VQPDGTMLVHFHVFSIAMFDAHSPAYDRMIESQLFFIKSMYQNSFRCFWSVQQPYCLHTSTWHRVPISFCSAPVDCLWIKSRPFQSSHSTRAAPNLDLVKSSGNMSDLQSWMLIKSSCWQLFRSVDSCV
jgi:hypothetical protein